MILNYDDIWPLRDKYEQTTENSKLVILGINATSSSCLTGDYFGPVSNKRCKIA